MHAILFDIDGTLVNTRGAGRAAIDAALQHHFGKRDEQQVEMSGRTDRAIARELFLAQGIEDSDENWQRLANGYFEHLPATLADRQGHILPGITALLETLSQRSDLIIGLLTGNSPQGAQIKLAHFDLWEYFEFGGFGDTHLAREAVAVDALRHVQRRADIAGDRVLVVGDTPLDIRCARHIGAKAIAVLTGWHTREELEAERPDVLLEDLEDQAALLTQLQ